MDKIDFIIIGIALAVVATVDIPGEAVLTTTLSETLKCTVNRGGMGCSNLNRIVKITEVIGIIAALEIFALRLRNL
jgi:hypothetical protein